jgi:hypothetical protein
MHKFLVLCCNVDGQTAVEGKNAPKFVQVAQSKQLPCRHKFAQSVVPLITAHKAPYKYRRTLNAPGPMTQFLKKGVLGA